MPSSPNAGVKATVAAKGVNSKLLITPAKSENKTPISGESVCRYGMIQETIHLFAPTEPATKPMAIQPATKTRNIILRFPKFSRLRISTPGR